MNAIRSSANPDLGRAIGSIHEQLENQSATDGPLLVGISGIHASGKGHVTRLIENALCADGYCIASINADGWRKLPVDDRIPGDPGRAFYHDDAQLDDLFNQVLLPLKHFRQVHAETDSIVTISRRPEQISIDIRNVDVILVEGLFLFKTRFQEHIDLMVWVDCLPETAMQRAIDRRQAGMPEEAIGREWRSVYFPAQILYFTADQPRAASDVIVFNDPRMFLKGEAGSVC